MKGRLLSSLHGPAFSDRELPPLPFPLCTSWSTIFPLGLSHVGCEVCPISFHILPSSSRSRHCLTSDSILVPTTTQLPSLTLWAACSKCGGFRRKAPKSGSWACCQAGTYLASNPSCGLRKPLPENSESPIPEVQPTRGPPFALGPRRPCSGK